jgi:hypothetical protein
MFGANALRAILNPAGSLIGNALPATRTTVKS